MRLRLYLCALCLVAAAAVPASAGAVNTAHSRNWAGYAVTAKPGSKFRKVAGTWVVKKPDCSTQSPAYSTTWVGLGGFDLNATKVEQTGIDADCSNSGKPRYRAWYELLPAPAHYIDMKVRAGDRMSGSVTVQGSSVTLRLRNVTSGASFNKTTSMSKPDVSSAEWIVETPSLCDDQGCFILPLADFGTMPFSNARAWTGNGNGKPISYGSYSAWRIRMRTAGNGPGKPANSDGATASKLSSGGTAFSVTYRSQVPNSAKRAKTYPAFKGH